MAALNLTRAPSQENVSTTLDGSLAAGATSVTVVDGSKVQSPCYLVIDRIDGNGNKKATSLWEYIYVSAGGGTNTLTIERGKGGTTDQAHSSGAIVEAIVTAAGWEGLYTVLNTALTDDATGLKVSTASISGITYTTRLINTSIASIARVVSDQLIAPQLEVPSASHFTFGSSLASGYFVKESNPVQAISTITWATKLITEEGWDSVTMSSSTSANKTITYPISLASVVLAETWLLGHKSDSGAPTDLASFTQSDFGGVQSSMVTLTQMRVDVYANASSSVTWGFGWRVRGTIA